MRFRTLISLTVMFVLAAACLSRAGETQTCLRLDWEQGSIEALECAQGGRLVLTGQEELAGPAFFTLRRLPEGQPLVFTPAQAGRDSAFLAVSEEGFAAQVALNAGPGLLTVRA